jgi:hypothetical protein
MLQFPDDLIETLPKCVPEKRVPSTKEKENPPQRKGLLVKSRRKVIGENRRKSNNDNL